MKKYCVLLLMGLLLCGCTSQETMETISDEILVPVMAQPRNIAVELPGEAALPVVENDAGRIYLCDEYEIVLQTLDGGDLDRTMQTVSGLERDQLTMMETVADDVARYEFVWTSAGERGEQLGRGVILDDGSYHYCLSVLRNAEKADKSQINWNQVFGTFKLV